jgi:hypothetical protein
MRTVQSTISNLLPPPPSICPPLPPPLYIPQPENEPTGGGICLAVESMRHHTTDEGWQVMAGLASTGYELCGAYLPINSTDVDWILDVTRPSVCVVQDKREWDVPKGDFRDPAARFQHIESLKERHDIFKITILKDAHQRPGYHRQSADEMGVHAWIVYYHPVIVKHLAPYVRSEHLIRTYHTVDAGLVPAYTAHGREGCLLSGALSGVYPLRNRLAKMFKGPEPPSNWTFLHHPGYHRKGCATPAFLRTLSRFKVAICTSSIYGYALRKIIESTACGCRVVTDLPADDVLPEIDGNLTRIDPSTPSAEVVRLVESLAMDYDPVAQKRWADAALLWYDYRVMGKRLADKIELLRMTYNRLGPLPKLA